MATTINEFLPFADQSNANLIPYAEWVSAAKRLTGFVSGIAKSNEMNRVWAQGAQAGYAIAKFIERTLNEDVYVADGERLADQFYRSIVQMSYRATPIGCVLTFPVHVEIDGYVATNNGGNLSQTTYDLLYGVYAQSSILRAHWQISSEFRTWPTEFLKQRQRLRRSAAM